MCITPHPTSSLISLFLSIFYFLCRCVKLMTAESSSIYSFTSKASLSSLGSVSNIHLIYHLCPLPATARDSLPFVWMPSNPFSAVLPSESPKSTFLYSFQSAAIVLRVNLMSYEIEIVLSLSHAHFFFQKMP